MEVYYLVQLQLLPNSVGAEAWPGACTEHDFNFRDEPFLAT